MVILWDQVSQRFQKTSASLQSSDQDLNIACAFYESLHGYIQAKWSTFSDIEQKAKDLTECENYQQQTRRFSLPFLSDEQIAFIRNTARKAVQRCIGCWLWNGYNARLLGPFFLHVTGTDISNAQLEIAVQDCDSSNIKYQIGSAEKIELPSSSVQLVTACQCAHFFDLPKFFEEADRVLVPNGVLAISGCNLSAWKEGHEKEITEVFKEFNIDRLKNYRDDELQLLDNWNQDITLPYTESVRIFPINLVFPRPFGDIVGQVTSWSGVQRMFQEDAQKGDELIRDFRYKLANALELDAPTDDAIVTCKIIHVLLMGRKPSSLI
ncbi:putative methyltransferase DDB_G0268948 [Tachypleus tridentatus]|uniref:putative methyltransferase DDB_G0268948 n=1 Tax=Tachypleus tridentatus TaxID=6853 RepID=UPI003FD030A9